MQLSLLIGCLTVLTVVTQIQAHITPSRGKENAAKKPIKKNGCYEILEENRDDLQVVCSRVQSLQEVLPHFSVDHLPKITALTFTQSSFTVLSLDDLSLMSALKTISFNHSYIPSWRVPAESSVPNITTVILNDCWNNYKLLSPHQNASLEFTSNMFDGLTSLEQLHLVNCYVSNMTAEIFANITSLKMLYISDGSGIGCEPHMEWVLDWMAVGKAVVANDTDCFVPRDLDRGGGVLVMSTFYSLSGHPFLLIMGYRKETRKYCPKECDCVVEGFNDGINGLRQRNDPIINIYCDNAGLTELPELPPHSTRLSFAYNNITDISKLFTNENYRAASSIRLEHNRISHLDGDLFYNFLKDRSHDLFITLNNNNFSTLPVKQMMRFYREARVSDTYNPFFNLEFNPWDCSDCSFIPEFQEMVYYQFYYRELGVNFYDDIRCAESNEFFAGQMVIKLDVQSLCAPDPPFLEPIDILNISLAAIIILLVVNFAHNFYHYRRHSKLPWIVTKMPCC